MPLTTHVGTEGKMRAATTLYVENGGKGQAATNGALFTRTTYPDSPFDSGFNTQLLLKTQGDGADDRLSALNLDDLLRWLCTAPKMSTFRVNTILYKAEDVFKLIKENIYNEEIRIEIHPVLREVVVVHNVPITNLDLEPKLSEVIVDIHCAASILRGAHVFAPGVLGMQTGTKLNDKVSIYADISRQCRKGYSKIYDSSQKVFIGNGIAKMIRNDLFGENVSPQGIAIEVYSNISGCPNLKQENLPIGSCVLQNLPSIVCVQVLSPKPDETILDMCASPGNKTTHIAALMENKGVLIAIDKTPNKIKQLERTCEKFEAKVKIFQADSTKILRSSGSIDILNGPPFLKESFDRILLDAPCSALGKRPQFYNNTTERVIRSYVPLQRKLFRNAVELLKVNGILVYSTCTIALAENEGIVSWGLKTFNCLKLVKAVPYFGSKGWIGTDLKDEQLQLLQRFHNNTPQVDSVGFFIACFVKK